MSMDRPSCRESSPLIGGHASLADEDDERLALLARSDGDALGELYGRYVERIYRFNMARTGDEQDAQDLTSQTFLAAVESIERYSGLGSFAGWLFGIARHKLADHYRRRKHELSLENLELVHGGPSPETLADARMRLGYVVRAMRVLDEQQAEAVALRVFGGLSAREVGQAMGKSEAAAKMLVYRGLRTLQDRLSGALEVSS